MSELLVRLRFLKAIRHRYLEAQTDYDRGICALAMALAEGELNQFLQTERVTMAGMIGQYSPQGKINLDTIKAAIAAFGRHPNVFGLTPTEIQLHPADFKTINFSEVEVKFYGKQLCLPIKADRHVHRNHIFVCCPDPDYPVLAGAV